MEKWMKDLAVIEEKYSNAPEGTDEATIDKYLMSLEDIDDSCDEELDESVCHSGDIKSPQINKEDEARIIERLRCIRKDYESNYKLMGKENLLIKVFSATEGNPSEPSCHVNEEYEEEDSLTLYDWYISLTSQLSVIVIGKRHDSGSLWHTTPIAERVNESPMKLRTVSGSLYILEDEMDEKSMQLNNFPASITNQFRYGFPKSWQSLIWNYASQFGFDKPNVSTSTKDDHSKGYKLDSSMEGGYMTGKRKFEMLNNSPDFSPVTTHFLPKKRTRIGVLREFFELMEDSVNLAKDLSHCESGYQKSTTCKRNGKRRRYARRRKDEEMQESIRTREEEEKEEIRKDLMKTSRNELLLLRDNNYEILEMNRHESNMTLRSRANVKKEMMSREEDKQKKKWVKHECTEEPIHEQNMNEKNMNGYYLRNRSIPDVKIESLESHHTPVVSKAAKPLCNGSSIKIRRKRRRGPRLVFGRPTNRTPKGGAPKGGIQTESSLSHGSVYPMMLNEMKGEDPSIVPDHKNTGSRDPKSEYQLHGNGIRCRKNDAIDPKGESKDCGSESKDCGSESNDPKREWKENGNATRGRKSKSRDRPNESRGCGSASRSYNNELSDFRIELKDACKPLSGAREEKPMPSKMMYLSSDIDSDVEEDLKEFPSRYDMQSRKGNKPIYSDMLCENRESGKGFATESRGTSVSGARKKKNYDCIRVKERKRKGERKKVLKPKIRFNDDWDKDIRFSSDEHTETDANELRVYPRRVRSRRESVPKITSGDGAGNEEPVEFMNDPRGIGYGCEKRNKSNSMRDDKEMKVKKTLDGMKKQAPSGRNEVMIQSCNGDEDEWDENETDRLQYAMYNFQPESHHDWQKVAYFVGVKSPAACQRKYQQITYPVHKKFGKKRCKGLKKKEVKNLPVIADIKFNDFVTAKRGTLRRRKQLREFFEGYDRGYEDNIFDSTPYRNRKRTVKLPFDVRAETSGLISPLDEMNSNNSNDDNDHETSGSASFTVSPNDSTLNSPSNLFQTNILMPTSRDPAEAYLYKLQKLRKSKPASSRTQTKATSDVQKSKINLQNIRNVKSPSVAFHLGHKYFDDYFDQSNEEKDEYFEEDISD